MNVTETTKFLLWPLGAPGAQGNEDSDKPTLTYYPAPAGIAAGSAVVVCPGGGYIGLADDHEGRQIAEWLQARGVAAFVLHYRLGPRYHHPIELGDAQRALRTVRAGASGWGIDPQRIGVWGFSAGGHLASTVATHYDAGQAQAEDPIERVSCRPDFAILCYPVITLQSPTTNPGSLINLLGENPTAQLIDLLSNELQVTADTPPTFLFHTTNDGAVPVANSIIYYQALVRAGVAAEMHIYEDGPHGVGLAPDLPKLANWSMNLANWLAGHGWLGRSLAVTAKGVE